VHVRVPGKIAGGCPRIPVANNSTATASAAAAAEEHKHSIRPDRQSLNITLTDSVGVFKALFMIVFSDCLKIRSD